MLIDLEEDKFGVFGLLARMAAEVGAARRTDGLADGIAGSSECGNRVTGGVSSIHSADQLGRFRAWVIRWRSASRAEKPSSSRSARWRSGQSPSSRLGQSPSSRL